MLRKLVCFSLVVASAGLWLLSTEDCDQPGTAVFGLYRDRSFVLNAAVSYVTFLAVLTTLLPLTRRALWLVMASHVGLAILLVLAEGAAMLGLVSFLPQGRPAWEVTMVDLPSKGLRHATVPHIDVHGERTPSFVRVMGLDADPIPYHIETDRYGFRNPREKTSPRVICIGDSMIVAAHVSVENTVTERLERRLDVSVLNAISPAYSPQEELIRLFAAGIGLDGVLVLHFLFEGNDLADSSRWRRWMNTPRHRAAWPRTGLIKSVLLRFHRPKKCGSERLGWFPKGSESAEDVYFWFDAGSTNADLGELKFIEDSILDGCRQIRAAGGTYAVVMVPSKVSVMHEYCSWPDGSQLSSPEKARSEFPGAIERFCEAEGIPYIDTTPTLQEYASRGILPFISNDEHMNEHGQAAMADALVPWLSERLSEAAGREDDR